MARSSSRRLGDFTIVDELAGKGGQGRLFSARCDRDGAFPGLAAGQVVVLKVMPVRGDDPDKAYRRLKRRTDALVASSHPGIVRYWGCFAGEGGLGDDVHVVVMELLHGETLEERLKREPLGLDAAETLRIVRTCLEALVCASGHGIVHRDLKPSNVFLCDDGGVKLIDFEIAQTAAAQTTTESGAMQGTYDYMAPDFHPDFRPDPKFRGDACSDVFSLSVVFHEALTGRRPYPSGDGMLGDQSMMAFFRRWSRDGQTDASRMVRVDALRVHALRHVQRILKKGLSPERAGRYRSYAEMLEALSSVSVRELRGGKDAYRLSVCVGKGGFGAVYRAWRASDGTPVAVKFLMRADSDGRFWREARTLERFSDDRIVSFVESFEVGRETRMPVLVMGFLPHMPGSSLKDRLSADSGRSGLPAAEVLPAFVRFAEGLSVLHRDGVVHRDVKPANLYLPAGEPEKACLMDLGIVRTDETQTNGGLPGTPDYMAPELARSATRGDARSDVYSLGLCLYEALCGTAAYPRLPRGSAAYPAWFERARSGEKPDLSGLDWYPEARKVVALLVDPDPLGRPYSASKTAALIKAVPVRERAPAAGDPETGMFDTSDGTGLFDESADNIREESPDRPGQETSAAETAAAEGTGVQPDGATAAGGTAVAEGTEVQPDGAATAGGTAVEAGTVAPTAAAGETAATAAATDSAATEALGGPASFAGRTVATAVASTASAATAVADSPESLAGRAVAPTVASTGSAMTAAPGKAQSAGDIPASPERLPSAGPGPRHVRRAGPFSSSQAGPSVREVREKTPWSWIVFVVGLCLLAAVVGIFHDEIRTTIMEPVDFPSPLPPAKNEEEEPAPPAKIEESSLTEVEVLPESPVEIMEEPPAAAEAANRISDAEAKLEDAITEIVADIGVLRDGIGSASSEDLADVNSEAESLKGKADAALSAAREVEGVSTGAVFREQSQRFRHAADELREAVEARRAKFAEDKKARLAEEKRRKAREAAEGALAKAVADLKSKSEGEWISILATASLTNDVKRIRENAVAAIADLSKTLLGEAKAAGVSEERRREFQKALDAAGTSVAYAAESRLDKLAEEEARRIVEAKRKEEEAARLAEEKRENEFKDLEEEAEWILSLDVHEGVVSRVEEKINDPDLPENWKSRYRKLKDDLSRPFALNVTNNSGIPVLVTVGDNPEARLESGASKAFGVKSWSGTVKCRAVPAEFPQDYEEPERIWNVTAGKAGGSKDEKIPGFTAKRAPVVVVGNPNAFAIKVSGFGGEPVSVEAGKSGEVEVGVRTPLSLAAGPGADVPLAKLYGIRTVSVPGMDRGTKSNVEFKLDVDVEKFDAKKTFGRDYASALNAFMSPPAPKKTEIASKTVDAAKTLYPNGPEGIKTQRKLNLGAQYARLLYCALKLDPKNEDALDLAKRTRKALEESQFASEAEKFDFWKEFVELTQRPQ